MNDHTQPIGPILTSSPPVMSDDEAAALAAEHYGIKANVRRLTSERDTNFQLVDDAGRAFVLKIANAAEPPEITNLQTEALLHIEHRDASLPVPRMQRTRDGKAEIFITLKDKTTSVVRLLTFLEGEPLHRVSSSRKQRRNIGHCLARLGLVLRDFEHPAADHDLLWDIKNASRLRTMLPSIADMDLRSLAERRLDLFDSELAPILPRLRSQVVHNDFNPHNVLVDVSDPDEIAGILDFGDMVKTPLIIDIAVASSYQIGDAEHPLAFVGEFVSAYHEISPLLPEEVDVLFDLIKTRLITTIAITNWRAARYPENRDYILRNNQPARAGLARLETITRDEARQCLRRACGLE